MLDSEILDLLLRSSGQDQEMIQRLYGVLSSVLSVTCNFTWLHLFGLLFRKIKVNKFCALVLLKATQDHISGVLKVPQGTLDKFKDSVHARQLLLCNLFLQLPHLTLFKIHYTYIKCTY